MIYAQAKIDVAMKKQAIESSLGKWAAWMLGGMQEAAHDEKIGVINNEINELRLDQPWTYWALCYHCQLMKFWKYPKLDPEEAYLNALDELYLQMTAKGIEP